MSGQGFGYPHYMKWALSSEPKLQAIWAVVLSHDFWGKFDYGISNGLNSPPPPTTENIGG